MRIEQLAMDSGIARPDRSFNLAFDFAGQNRSLAVDTSAFLEEMKRCNPAGGRTKQTAFNMKFGGRNQYILDESDESRLFKGRAEMMINDALGLAMDDTYGYNIPSSGVPNVLTTIWTTKFFKQFFQSTPFREMTTPDQQGAFGTTDVKYPLIGAAGTSKLYSDNTGLGDSSINLNYLTRQVVTLERTVSYGDLQTAIMAYAKVDYVGWLREYIATLITLDQNNIGFNGFQGMQCFGLLNDPTLNATLPAAAGQWLVSGTYASVIEDILTTVQSIQTIGAGQVETDKEFIIGLPPVLMQALYYQNSFGLNVKQYILSIYPKARFIQVQNYTGTGTPLGSSAPNYMQVIFKELVAQETALGVFSTLYNSHGVVRELSSYNEKVSYAVAGAVVTMPIGIATMNGI